MDEQSSPRIIDALWRYRRSSAVIVTAVVGLSIIVALFTGGSTGAQARLVLKTPEQSVGIGAQAGTESAFVRYLNQRALFATSDRVLDAAAGVIGGQDAPDQLRDVVSASASDTGESILVRVEAGSAEQSVRILDAVVAAYRAQSGADVEAATATSLDALAGRREAIEQALPDGPGQSRTDANIAAAAQSLSELDKQATEIRLAADQFGDGVFFVHDPVADSGGLVRTVVRDAMIGLALGTLLAAVVAWVRADRDRPLARPADLAAVAPEPVLGEIERFDRMDAYSLQRPYGQPTWSYRLAVAAVQREAGRGVVVLTGSPGSGATTTALQLANAAARDGVRVLLVDAVLRSRELSGRLGLLGPEHGGLMDLATESATLADVVRPVNLGDDDQFWAVPAGPSVRGGGELIRAAPLRHAVEQMRAEYDLVLIDAAPPALAPETAPILREADTVVVAVRHGSAAETLGRLRDQVRMVGGTVAGYLLTFRPAPADRRG